MKTKLVSHEIIGSLSDFQKFAALWAENISAKTVLALSGPMGAGKTEFIKSVCRKFGITEANSPTFAIHHHYQSAKKSIEHLDLYRLKSEDELESTGFWDFFSEPEGLILIEWSQNMDLDLIPKSWDLWILTIEVENEIRNLRLEKRIDEINF